MGRLGVLGVVVVWMAACGGSSGSDGAASTGAEAALESDGASVLGSAPEAGRAAQAAIDSMFAAMNRADTTAILAHYQQTDDFVYVGCTSVQPGFEYVARVARVWYSRNPDPQFEHEVMWSKGLDANTAVVTVSGQSATASDLYWTYVLQRGDDGRWRIAHEHESWPGCRAGARRHPGSMPTAPPAADSGAAADAGAGAGDAG